MNQFIIVQSLYGFTTININEISQIKDENLSFKKSTIIMNNKTTVDCLETSRQIFDKINNNNK